MDPNPENPYGASALREVQQIGSILHGSSHTSNTAQAVDHRNETLLLFTDATCWRFHLNSSEYSKLLANHIRCNRYGVEPDQIRSTGITYTVADNPTITCLALTTVISQQACRALGMRKDDSLLYCLLGWWHGAC